jgi:iron complex outermembrane recepter protein
VTKCLESVRPTGSAATQQRASDTTSPKVTGDAYGARMLASAAVASALALAAPAFGQTAPAGSDATEAGAPLAEVVVTGSIIPTANGYQAPTPVTVAEATLLKQTAPANLVQGLNALPQFLGSTGPQTVTFTQTVQGDVLNLRGLGANRTLILMDGIRVPPTSYLNTVDVDVLPQLLMQRVDIVTGGASATYGSDAVAGVVNFVLNTRFTGVKVEAMGGISTFGDNQNERFGLAGGTPVGENGHFIGSAEFYRSDGFRVEDRPDLNDSGGAVGSVVGSKAAPGTALNPYINVPNTRASYATFGGIATSGPFAGTNFASSGLYGPVQTGTPTGTSTFFQAPSDYIRLPPFNTAAAPVRNVNGFARYSYALGEDTSAYVQLLAAQARTSAVIEANFMALPGFTIYSGNGFLPAPLQTQLGAVPSFGMSAQYNYLGPITEQQNVDNYAAQAGIKGKLGRFSWTLDYSFGDSINAVKAFNEINFQHFYAAVDAVVNPANGAIVCRPQLSTNPAVATAYAGCQPFNPFGAGAASAAAAAYVTGTSQYDVVTSQHNIQGNIGGELFSLPAGPITGAVGFDYRSQKLSIASNANPGTPYDTTGLRGTSVLTQYYLINQSNASGSENVTEGFGELGIPLLRDLPLVQSLDLNGAVRYTRYSISGSATTWKFGGTWQVDKDLAFRATESRDIRAPTLYDLFAGEQVSPVAVTDPHTGVSSGAPQITSGNPNLEAEIGTTFTVGVIYQPHFLDGLALSLDYYRLAIKGAVATLTALAEDQACEASNGASPACANIIRPHPFSDRSADNYPTQFLVSGVNVAAIHTDGFDLDATYNRTLLGGKLTTRAYASYINKFSTQLTANQAVIDYAGWNAAGSGGVAGAIPHFKGALSVGYTTHGYGAFIQENMIGSLRLGPVLKYVNTHVPGFFTTDLTLTYDGLPPIWGGDVELFLTTKNLFNLTPPRVYSTAVPGGVSTINTLYDITGRSFVVGLRMNFK